MSIQASLTFTQSTSVTIPGGVTQVSVTVNYPVVSTVDSASQTGLGSNQFFSRTNNGNIYSWGGGTSGTLGSSVLSNQSSPRILTGSPTYTNIYQNYLTCWGIDYLGGLYGWGVNTSYQVGDGTVTQRNLPTIVASGLNFVQVFPGAYLQAAPYDTNVMALTQSGTLYGWGANSNRVISNAAVTYVSTPTIISGGKPFVQMQSFFSTLGGSSWYGLTDDGTLYAWGGNFAGQLGVGDTTNRSTPTPVIGGYKFVSIAAVYENMLALTADNTLYAWGRNANGELGQNDTIPRSSPVAVPGYKFYKLCTSQGETSGVFGILINGWAMFWGGTNDKGQGGIGSVGSVSSPQFLAGFNAFSDVIPGPYHTLGIRTDGTVYSWGDNTYGSLGDGTRTSASSPVAVLTGPFANTQIIKCRTNINSSYAFGTNGSIYAWGRNNVGQLGLNNALDQSSPVVTILPFATNTVSQSMVNNIQKEFSFTVKPGKTYALSITANVSSFGQWGIGFGKIDSVIINFIQ